MPDPAPPADGVVLEVGATGICRSDWHAWQGHDPGIEPPHIPGHELAGTVVAVGPEVRRVAVGDRVTVPFCLGCGACATCLAGETQVCDHDYQPGFTGPGSWARFVALPHADLNVVALPEGLDMVAAAALGCRFMTAWAAVHVHGRVRAGEWVAVHGCGGVGLSAVMIAAAAGARVVAVDIDREKLGRARRLGAEAAVDATRRRRGGGARGHGRRRARLARRAGQRGDRARRRSRSLRKHGRHVQVGLMLADDRVAPVPMARVIAFELSLHGVHGMAVRHYPALLGAVAAGVVDPTLLVGATVGLDDAGAELAAMGGFARTGATVITSF